MKTLGQITTVGIFIVCGFFIGLLYTHVLLSVSYLYQLKFITQFSFVQIYGTISIIGLIKYKYSPRKKTTDTFSEALIESITQLLTEVVVILSCWGISFIAYYIIK